MQNPFKTPFNIVWRIWATIILGIINWAASYLIGMLLNTPDTVVVIMGILVVLAILTINIAVIWLVWLGPIWAMTKVAE